MKALFKPLPETMLSEPEEEQTELASLNLKDEPEPMNKQEQ